MPCRDRPREIIANDLQFTAKVTLSGETYGIDFLSWALDRLGCVDADAGVNCAAAGGRTSYNREPTVSDSTAPTTTINLSPTMPDGDDDWYVSDVLVAVAASDDTAVTETRCVLDPASAPATFAAIPAGCAYMGSGADVTGDGSHDVYAASTDEADNDEMPVGQLQD